MEEVQTKLNVVFTLYFFLMLLTKTIDQQPLLGFVRASPVGEVFPQRRDDVPQRRDGAARVLDDGVRGRAARLVRHATPPVWLHHTESGQTLQGSFSAVLKPNFATKYSLESSRRDLTQALRFPSLQSQTAKNCRTC